MGKSKSDLFHQEMMRINNEAKKLKLGNFARFHRIVSEYGGVEAAKKLLNRPVPSDGFIKLSANKEYLKLTSEYLMIQDEWNELFETEEIEKARERLRTYGYQSL